MKIRYQADAALNQNIVTGVLRREPTIDFQTATAARLEGVKDSEQNKNGFSSATIAKQCPQNLPNL